MKLTKCYYCEKKITGKKHKIKRKVVCNNCFYFAKVFENFTPDNGFGGINKKMFWKEYISMFKTKKMKVGLEKLKKYVIKNNLLGMTDQDYYKSELYGKYGIYLTSDAWGDFMSALMNTIEKKRKYDYRDFIILDVVDEVMCE
jgi:hypothetical protein